MQLDLQKVPVCICMPHVRLRLLKDWFCLFGSFVLLVVPVLDHSLGACKTRHVA